MLRNFLASRVKPQPGARERSLKAVEQWKRADEELRRVCQERGIPVPVLVC